MLKLRAAAWEDGYAIVEQDDQLVLIRPPYRLQNRSRVALKDIETAVQKYGFAVAEASFDSWADLIGHLKQRFIEIRRQDSEPDGVRIRQLAERAPREVVQGFLHKIEHELLVQREWRAASGLLTHLLRNPVVRTDGAMLEAVSNLLERAQAGRDDADFAAHRSSIEVEFPRLRPEHFELAKRIRRDGQILAMGSAA